MKFNPLGKEIVGRNVDIVKTASGLILPDSKNNVTLLMLVDSVGPDVTRCKPGDLILPHKINHAYFRGGFHRVLCVEEDVRHVVTELSLDQCNVEKDDGLL